MKVVWITFVDYPLLTNVVVSHNKPMFLISKASPT